MALRRVTRRLTPELRIEREVGWDRRWLLCQERVEEQMGDAIAWTKAVGDNIILHEVKIHIDPVTPGASLNLEYEIKTGLTAGDNITRLDEWDWVFRSGLGNVPLGTIHMGSSETVEFRMRMQYRGLGRRFGFLARVNTAESAMMWVGFLIEEIGR